MVKEGYRFALPLVVLGLLCYFPGWRIAGALLLFFGLFILYFFRDPDRIIPSDPDAVVSPADGRVVEIEEEEHEGRQGCRISIFLSVWNVHVQRSPVAGRISSIQYRPGRFYAALRARASEENEQNVIYISTPGGEMFFKQIAGWIARRVVLWKSKGAELARGDRVGMIRFGSRVDVWLPESAELAVRKGQNVAGGSSILARWKWTS
jgi:phosphatidylserine decarboxylase